MINEIVIVKVINDMKFLAKEELKKILLNFNWFTSDMVYDDLIVIDGKDSKFDDWTLISLL